MDDRGRLTYRGFGTFFLLVGGVFLLLGVIRMFLTADVLDGNPLWLAVLLLLVGGALRWTARERDDS